MNTDPLKDFDLNVNFWKVNPQLKMPESFNKLYKEDKSKGKKNSSQLMWAIALCYDPNSKFYNLIEKARKTLVEQDFAKEKIDWKGLEPQIELYKSLFMSQATRSLDNWKLKLEERDNYLNSIPYRDLDLKGAKDLDDLIANTPKLYVQYNKILEQLSEEAAKGATRGNVPESASEKKEL